MCYWVLLPWVSLSCQDQTTYNLPLYITWCRVLVVTLCLTPLIAFSFFLNISRFFCQCPVPVGNVPGRGVISSVGTPCQPENRNYWSFLYVASNFLVIRGCTYQQLIVIIGTSPDPYVFRIAGHLRGWRAGVEGARQDVTLNTLSRWETESWFRFTFFSYYVLD